MARTKFNGGTAGGESNAELSFFEPAKHLDAVAIIVEPREFVENSTLGPYVKDRIFGRVTIFDTEAMLDSGKATVLENATFSQKALVNDAKEYLPINGEAQQIAVVLEKKKGSDNAYYVFQEAPESVLAKVDQYLEGRDAALKAAAAGMPDFT